MFWSLWLGRRTFSTAWRIVGSSETQEEGWATCPITQCGFVRISSNLRLSPLTVTPRDALRLLRELTERPDHIFWPDSVAPCMEGLIPMDRVVGHRQITDAYIFSPWLRTTVADWSRLTRGSRN